MSLVTLCCGAGSARTKPNGRKQSFYKEPITLGLPIKDDIHMAQASAASQHVIETFDGDLENRRVSQTKSGKVKGKEPQRRSARDVFDNDEDDIDQIIADLRNMK